MTSTIKNESQVIFLNNKGDLLNQQVENISLRYPCTKFSIPPMQTTIAERATLLRKLDQTLFKKMSIANAPEGFGKTTIVSNWIYNRNYNDNTLWITLDSRDNNIYNFWHCITYGLFNQMHSQFEDCLNLFNAYSLYSIESIVNSLVNSLAKASKEILIVLDDFHNIKDTDLLNSLRFFLKHLTNNTHIILITQYKPNLQLFKLTIWDEILELSIDDFKFSIEETEDFLNNKMSMSLNDLELNDLYSRTAGWIIAIKLTAASLKRNPDKKGIMEHLNNCYKCLSEFLFDEIISEYSIEIQEFIIKASLLEILNVSLCNYVMFRKDSDKVFKNLIDNQIFIYSLDNSETGYRYHNLFAEILRSKLRLMYPELLEGLYLRASKWCEENGHICDAISYSIKSGNQENSSRLIEDFSENIFCGIDYLKFIEYIETLPNSTLENISVLLRYVLALAFTNKIDSPEVILKNRGVNIDEDIYSEYRGELLVIRAISNLSEGNLAEAEENSEKAIGAIDPKSKFKGYAYYYASYILTLHNKLSKASDYINVSIHLSEKHNDYNLQTMAIYHKSLILFQDLKLIDSFNLLKKALDLISIKNEMELCATASIYLKLGSLYYEFNDLNNSLYFIKKALEISIIRKDFGCVAQSYMYLSKIHYEKNEKDKAIEYFELAEGLFNKDILKQFSYQHLIDLVKGAIIVNDVNFAEQIAQKYYKLVPANFKCFYSFALTELLITQKKYTEAISIIEEIESTDLGKMKGLFTIYINNQYALCYHGLKIPQKSFDYVREVLKMSQDGGFIRSVVDYGCSMYDLLNNFIKAESHSKSADLSLFNYAKKLISHFNAANFKERRISNVQGNLTLREIETLKHLASGATNQEIATTLYLSINTVKKHVNNIFEKLNVKNRVQAAELYKQLRLE